MKEDKTVFSIMIFGGSRGIGKIIADYLITNGHEVSIIARNPVTLAKFKQSVEIKKLCVNTIKADITNEKEVARAFKSHSYKWGSSPDIVINCAAVQGPIGNSWTVSSKRWEEAVNTNLIGSFIVAKVAIRQMLSKGYGSIIMFSGGGAVTGRPQFSAYGVSKTGVLRMVETVAEELKAAGYHNIVINAVAPGGVKTDMTNTILRAGFKAGEKALAEAADVFKTGGTSPKEITDLIDFLMDPKANCWLTGRLIHVREDYKCLVKEFGASVPEHIGKLRRIPIQVKK